MVVFILETSCRIPLTPLLLLNQFPVLCNQRWCVVMHPQLLCLGAYKRGESFLLRVCFYLGDLR